MLVLQTVHFKHRFALPLHNGLDDQAFFNKGVEYPVYTRQVNVNLLLFEHQENLLCRDRPGTNFNDVENGVSVFGIFKAIML